MIYAHINKTIITVALRVLNQIKMVGGLNSVLDMSELSGQRFSSVRTLPSQLAGRAGLCWQRLTLTGVPCGSND